MNARRTQALLFSWTGALLTAGILALVNVLSTFAFLRLDLSAGRLYSVSSGTKAVLGRLTDDLLVKVYFTRRLPPQYALNGQYLRDLLGEYKSAGRGRVRVEFLDPEGDEKIKQEAMSAGVNPVRLSVMARDKFEIKEVFMGAALLYHGKSEVLPVMQNSLEFEYNLTQRIKKLSAAGLKTVGFVAGHGEKPVDDPVLAALKDQLDVESVNLDKPIPAKVDALWIIGPQTAYKPGQVERLKAWVDSGRSLGILLDRKEINTSAFASRPVDAGLDPLLSAWGVQPRDGFVADPQSERIQVQQRQGGFMFMNIIEYPFMPLATNINAAHPAMRGLDAVVFPFVHPVAFKAEGRPLKYTSLLDSTKDSWYHTAASVSPFAPAGQADSAEKGPFSLAGIIEGDFYSVTPSTAAATDAPQGDRPALGRVILAGTSRVIDPNFANKPTNISFFLNLVDWSLQDEAMLSIRSKGVSYRPLRRLGDGGRVLVKYALNLFLPALLLAVAFFVYRGQTIRRERLIEDYGR